MTYLKNCWYMSAWAHDVSPGKLISLQIAGQPLVIYRGMSGKLAVLEDRCPHKLAPLSAGQVEGDDIRCMYHGLKFSSGGRCNEIPGQTIIPSAISVRTYAVQEAHSAIWIWLGDPLRADSTLIPPFVGINDVAWRMLPGQTDYDANHRLIDENLLDLSHVVFVHRQSFAAGARISHDPMKTMSLNPGTLELLPRGVRQTRVIESGPVPPRLVPIAGEIADSLSTTQFLVPGIFLMTSDTFKAGAVARANGAKPPDDELVHRSFTCQAVTPMTVRTSRYFFAFGPWKESPLTAESFRDLGAKAFEEDRIMINAQQRVIDLNPGVKPKLLRTDRLGAMYKKLVENLLLAEASN